MSGSKFSYQNNTYSRAAFLRDNLSCYQWVVETPTNNKMWVLFVDLDDDETKSKCMNDTSGPKSLRYCGDGGVYYAYNFIEKGDGGGYRDYPWGADKMKFNLGIDPAVSSGMAIEV